MVWDEGKVPKGDEKFVTFGFPRLEVTFRHLSNLCSKGHQFFTIPKRSRKRRNCQAIKVFFFFWADPLISLHPPKTNILNLKIPPKGKGETSTQTTNFWGSMLIFQGVYFSFSFLTHIRLMWQDGLELT